MSFLTHNGNEKTKTQRRPMIKWKFNATRNTGWGRNGRTRPGLSGCHRRAALGGSCCHGWGPAPGFAVRGTVALTAAAAAGPGSESRAVTPVLARWAGPTVRHRAGVGAGPGTASQAGRESCVHKLAHPGRARPGRGLPSGHRDRDGASPAGSLQAGLRSDSRDRLAGEPESESKPQGSGSVRPRRASEGRA